MRVCVLVLGFIRLAPRRLATCCQHIMICLSDPKPNIPLTFKKPSRYPVSQVSTINVNEKSVSGNAYYVQTIDMRQVKADKS